jgi:uncharacterized membrane protein
MALLQVLETWVPNLAKVVRHDVRWMAWNTVLAWLPVALAFAVFRRRTADHVRTPLWWTGLVLFVLFLPNAPYVVTDLVHLGDSVLLVGGGWPVITGVLPVYGLFIGSGFVAYYLALRELGLYLSRMGLTAWRGVTLASVHALCAVGVYLGRHARLNSWEPVVEPHDTLQRVVLTLSWRWAPLVVAATFMVTVVGHFVTKAVLEATWSAVVGVVRPLWAPGPGPAAGSAGTGTGAAGPLDR